jgi:HSP20 family protein
MLIGTHEEGVIDMALAVRPQNQRSDVSRWDPMAELQRMQSQLGRLFEGWGDLQSVTGDGFFVPLADVEETDDAYVIELELPGVDKKDFDISMSGRRLSVTGERKEKERVGVLRRRTRTVGRFEYEIVLPGDVDENGVTAKLDEGVLTVRVPKAANDRPRRIEVK